VFDLDKTKTAIGVVTAVVALAGGGYQAAEKFGWLKHPILEWAPEHFSISDAPVDGTFDVVVARRKLRDDCEVEDFRLTVRDSRYQVHTAASSIARFAGPASDTVDKFGFQFTIDTEHQHMIAIGEATLLAYIKYKCPEGEVVVQYPDHQNLRFNITGNQS
jgi:hypothetical protein